MFELARSVCVCVCVCVALSEGHGRYCEGALRTQHLVQGRVPSRWPALFQLPSGAVTDPEEL